MKQVFSIILSFLLLFSGTAILLELAGIILSNRVIYSQSQPVSNLYEDGSYQVDVIKQQLSLRLNYLIIIHRAGVPDYGYVIKYPEDIIDPKNLINQIKWEKKGITLEFPDHAVLFIPSENFTKGR